MVETRSKRRESAEAVVAAVMTDVDLLRYIFSFQRGLPRDIAEQALTGRMLPLMAVQCGDIRLLQRLHQIRQEQPRYVLKSAFCFLSTWIEAVGAGDIKLATWLEGIDRLRPSPSNALARAIRSRSLEMMNYVARVYGQIPVECYHAHLAIESDAADALDWILPKCKVANPQLLAARNGSMNVIRYLHESMVSGWKEDVMDAAAGNGHLAVVRFLHQWRDDGATTKAMDAAAGNGHLDVVTFLHTHREEGCTTKAMDAAAGNGHVSVVEFLHWHRKEGCTTKALDDAVARGHGDIVRFLLENRHEGRSWKAIHDAFVYGHGHLAELLHNHSLRKLHPATPLFVGHATWKRFKVELALRAFDMIERAAADGDLGVVQLAHLHCHHHCTPYACVAAADRGHADIVSFLLLNCDAVQVSQVVRGAVRSGDLETVRRVVEMCTHEDLTQAVSLAHQHGFKGIEYYLTAWL